MSTQPLPVHRTIVCVDVAGFGDPLRTTPDQLAIRKGMYGSLESAFTQSEVPWHECTKEDRGDGVLILVPSTVPKSMVADRVPFLLAAALAEHNQSHDTQARVRLRMAMHAGEIQFDENGCAGKAVNLAFRLLNADPLKDALAGSSGALAVIASPWFYEEVIVNSPACRASIYRRADISVKETRTSAWICLPDDPYSHQRDEARQTPAAVGADVVTNEPRTGAILIGPMPPPEGILIRHARKLSGLSIREAARRAGVSEGRWRQIENGHQTIARGVYIPCSGPASTLAKMAQVVDLSPKALEEAGRPDAAEKLRGLS